MNCFIVALGCLFVLCPVIYLVFVCLSVNNLFIHSLVFFFCFLFIQSVVLDVPSHHEKAFEVS